MAKKIYDIIPPNQKSNSDSYFDVPIFVKSREEGRAEPAFPGQKKHKKPKTSRILFNILFIFVFLAATASAGWFLVYSKTKIAIWPKTSEMNISKTIVADSEQKNLDSSLWLEKSIIPAEIFKDIKIGSKDFKSSGKVLKEEKAKGKIKVYNEFSEAGQTLSAGTRFVSANGKLFKLVKKEIIPGGKYVKGKLSPGELDVEVIAAEAGKEYNIEPTTFSIPGFAGTSKYTAIYAKSFSEMTGGFKGEIAQISQDDLDKAEASLIDELKNEGKNTLQKTLPLGYILIDGAITYNTIEKTFSAKAEDEAESFNLSLKLESKAAIFKKTDAEKLVRQISKSNIEQGKKIQEERLEMNYNFKSLGYKEVAQATPDKSALKDSNAKKSPEDSKIDDSLNKNKPSELTKITFEISAKERIFTDINLDGIKKNILAKPFDEVRSILKDNIEIERAEIKPGFFWANRVPDNTSRIEISLKLD